MNEFILLLQGGSSFISNFFNFFSENIYGIASFGLSLLFLGFLINYLMWVLGWGRFKERKASQTTDQKPQTLRYLVADGLVKVINDFRHLLALLIILVFAFTLLYTLVIARGTIDNMKDMLQAVAATLGGLVGSIIGYYFGESTVRTGVAAGAGQNDQPPPQTTLPVQSPPDKKNPDETDKDKTKGVEMAPQPDE